MKDTFNLVDSDILVFDDATGNIVVAAEKLPNVSPDELIHIHFEEDSPELSHEYKVVGVEVDGIHLDWVRMLDESVLTEANPIDAIKNKFKKPTYADRVLKQMNKTEKANKKELSRAEKLVARDMSPEARNWKFYLPNAKGEYSSEPVSQDAAKEFYKNTVDGTMSPMVGDAIVVDEKDNFVRRGLEDLHSRQIFADRSLFKVKPEFSIKKHKEEGTNATTPNDVPPVETSAEDSSSNTAEPESKSSDAPTTPAPQSKGYSDKLLNKLKDIAQATGMAVRDPQGKEVDLNKENMRNLDIDTYTLTINGKHYPMRGWIEQAVAKDILTESCDPSSILVESLLFEAPQIILNDDELNNPGKIDFKDIVADRVEKDNIAKAEAEKEAAKVPLREKNAAVYQRFLEDKSSEVYYRLEHLFDALVPSSGKAETVAGEHVRAIMRLLFRDSNDGDKFFEGYGLDTCAPSAQYLADECEECGNIINSALEDAFRYDTDEAYTALLNRLTLSVLKNLENNEELFYTPNETDSRDYEAEYIIDHQPTYDYEIMGSDDIITLVENGVLTSWDLNSYVENQLEYESDYRGAQVDRPWGHHDTSVTVSELTRDGLDRLEDACRDLEGFWSDLVDEYADELHSDAEEEDEDSDYDDEYTLD